MTGETIIGAPFEPRPLREMLCGDDTPQPVYSGETAGDMSASRLFKIRSADHGGRRGSASVLSKRMYATRGYTTTGLPEDQPVPH